MFSQSMVKSFVKKDYLAIVAGILLVLAIQPFYVWHLPGRLNLLVLIAPIVPLIIKNDISRNKDAFVFFLVILLLNVLIHGYNLLYSIYLLAFVFVPFGKLNFTIKVYDFFKKALSVCLAISLMQWVLFWLGIGMPNFYVEPLTEAKPYDYTAYLPLLVVPNTILESFRFSACFDEPGVVGTICLLILFVEQFKLNGFYNIVILIAGICSFSMFFFGGTIGYFLIKYGLKKPLYIVMFLLVMGGFYLATKDNEVLDELVYSRFEWDEDAGSFAGDNRFTDVVDSYYNSIKGTSSYYFGLDEKKMATVVDEGSYGYKIAVMRYGMVFFASYVLFFLWFALKKRLSIMSFCFFAFALIATLYQRPNMYDVVYVFLFTQIIVSQANTRSRGISPTHVR